MRPENTYAYSAQRRECVLPTGINIHALVPFQKYAH